VSVLGGGTKTLAGAIVHLKRYYNALPSANYGQNTEHSPLANISNYVKAFGGVGPFSRKGSDKKSQFLRHSKLGAAGAGVLINFFRGGQDRFTADHFYDGLFAADTDRKALRAGTPFGERRKGLLYDAILQRVESNDRNPASGI